MTPTRICTAIIIIASVGYINGGFICCPPSPVSPFPLSKFVASNLISNIPDRIQV